MRHPWISITNWFEDFMAKHQKAAQFVNWYDPDVDPSDPASYPEEHAEFWQDTKSPDGGNRRGERNKEKHYLPQFNTPATEAKGGALKWT